MGKRRLSNAQNIIPNYIFKQFNNIVTPSGISQIPFQKYIQASRHHKLTLTRSTLQINHLAKIIQTFKYFPKLTLQNGLSKCHKNTHQENPISLFYNNTGLVYPGKSLLQRLLLSRSSQDQS